MPRQTTLQNISNSVSCNLQALSLFDTQNERIRVPIYVTLHVTLHYIPWLCGVRSCHAGHASSGVITRLGPQWIRMLRTLRALVCEILPRPLWAWVPDHPPSKAAAKQHSLWTYMYLQVQEWLRNRLSPTG